MRPSISAKNGARLPGSGSRNCSTPVAVPRIQRRSEGSDQATRATRWARMSSARPERRIARVIIP